MVPGRRRFAWWAVLLTVFSPGLGQLYNGQLAKALVYPLAVPIVCVLLSICALHMPYNGWTVLPFVLLALCLLASVVYLAIDAWDSARNAGGSYQLKPYNRGRWYFLFALLVWVSVGGALWLRSLLAAGYDVPVGSSITMVQAGDRVLVDKLAYTSGGAKAEVDEAGSGPGRGALVVYSLPGNGETRYLGRIVGLPGETVEIRQNLVYIDGGILTEPYVSWGREITRKAVKLKPGSYYVMGDDRRRVSDARTWGPVAQELILGRADRVVWSRVPGGGSVRWERIGLKLK